jgi:hypothetical protein
MAINKPCYFCHQEVPEENGMLICGNHPILVRYFIDQNYDRQSPRWFSFIYMLWNKMRVERGSPRHANMVEMSFLDNNTTIMLRGHEDIELDFIPPNWTPENIQEKIKSYLPFI